MNDSLFPIPRMPRPQRIEAITKDGEVISLSDNLGLRGRVLRVGWEPPDDLTEAEWKCAGETLGNVERSVSWWLGDWWAFGERKFRGGRALVESEGWDGPTYGTCRNAAVVCRSVPMSRRRDNLSFKHHAEVAALPPDVADELLDWAEETIPEKGKPRSAKELRGEVNRRRVTVGQQPSDATCKVKDLDTLVARGRKFGCIYADPPWLYDNQGTRAATGNHYEGLTVDQLCELPVGQLAADDAHLHLWITNGFLFDAPRIFKAWGFEFKGSFVWCKPQMGLGNYWRNSHEILLTAIRGDAARFNDKSLMSWMTADRAEHSAKPPSVRNMVELASPGPYLELFGRSAIEGWTVFGNQIEQDLFLGGGDDE